MATANNYELDQGQLPTNELDHFPEHVLTRIRAEGLEALGGNARNQENQRRRALERERCVRCYKSLLIGANPVIAADDDTRVMDFVPIYQMGTGVGRMDPTAYRVDSRNVNNVLRHRGIPVASIAIASEAWTEAMAWFETLSNRVAGEVVEQSLDNLVRLQDTDNFSVNSDIESPTQVSFNQAMDLIRAAVRRGDVEWEDVCQAFHSERRQVVNVRMQQQNAARAAVVHGRNRRSAGGGGGG